MDIKIIKTSVDQKSRALKSSWSFTTSPDIHIIDDIMQNEIQIEIDNEILGQIYVTQGWIFVPSPRLGWEDTDRVKLWLSTNLPEKTWHLLRSGCCFLHKEHAMEFQLAWG